jgi:hypothetical protein
MTTGVSYIVSSLPAWLDAVGIERFLFRRMNTAYFVTQSPVPDLYFVAKWDFTGERYLETVICGVPVAEVNIRPDDLKRVIYPNRDGLPIPADELGIVREGDGHILLSRPDSSGLAKVAGWRVEKPERKGKNIGWGLLELTFRLAYTFGFAGIQAPFDGLHTEFAPRILSRLSVLASRYQANMNREDGSTWVVIRWTTKPDYRPPLLVVAIDEPRSISL